MNREQYNSDTRYKKVLHNMDLLGIMDITTTRQHKNGTIVWKLPIKNHDNRNPSCIEVASFSTGYVRNQNSGYSNYQLNKRCDSEPQYYKCTNKHDGSDLYRKFTTRSCKLIPIEIDRLEYLISYCLKNYFIKRANQVVEGRYVSKWYHEWELEKANDQIKKLDDFHEASTDFNNSMLEGMVPKWKYDEAMELGKTNAEAESLNDCGHYDRINELEDSLESSDYRIKDLERMLDGHKGRETNHDQELEKAHDKIKKLDDFYEASKRFNDSMYEGRDYRVKDLENKLDTIQRIADYGQTEQ